MYSPSVFVTRILLTACLCACAHIISITFHASHPRSKPSGWLPRIHNVKIYTSDRPTEATITQHLYTLYVDCLLLAITLEHVQKILRARTMFDNSRILGTNPRIGFQDSVKSSLPNRCHPVYMLARQFMLRKERASLNHRIYKFISCSTNGITASSFVFLQFEFQESIMP